jgi:hypothetical protein
LLSTDGKLIAVLETVSKGPKKPQMWERVKALENVKESLRKYDR